MHQTSFHAELHVHLLVSGLLVTILSYNLHREIAGCYVVYCSVCICFLQICFCGLFAFHFKVFASILLITHNAECRNSRYSGS